MPISTKNRQAYRADEKQGHALLAADERRRILKASLPKPVEPSSAMANKQNSRFGIRRFFKGQVYVLVFAVLHGIFSLYIRLRQWWNLVSYQVSSVLYYHHATPEYIRRDVTGLDRMPKHLSCILTAEAGRGAKSDLDRLIDETAEIATWSACAEIPMLSVYEKTGS
jgi:dehydrodolichyl diphosphate syntase complex subunit NUS1